MLRIRRRPRIHASRGQRLGPAQTASRHRTLGREGGLLEQPYVRDRAFGRSGVPYVSIVYLVDACTTPKENPGA